MSALMVFLGGGIGSVTRFFLSELSKHFFSQVWPATFFVNVTGSLIYLAITAKYQSLPSQYQQFIEVGMLGGLTTFSTFSFEVFTFVQKGQLGLALTVLGLNIFFGIAMGIWIFGPKFI